MDTKKKIGIVNKSILFIFIQIGSFILLLFSLSGCASQSQSKSDVPQRELTEIEKAFIATNYELIYRIKELPKPIATLLLQRVRNIANPGESYNATDMMDPSLPSTQLTWGGISKDRGFVLYKQGGFAPHQQLLIVELKQNQILTSGAFIIPYNIDDIVTLKWHVASGKAVPIK